MKLHYFILLAAGLLLTGTGSAQTTAPSSGTIAYETMRRTDMANIRVNINGQEVRPGGTLPNGRTFDVPETMEGLESFRFAGQWAMREPLDRRNMMQMRMQGGPGGGGGGGQQQAPSADQMRRMDRMRNMRFPIEETTHTDLATGKMYTIT
ncbi:MAG TPA: GLPGLI family protein, partial [Fibrella sp.]